MIRLREVRWDKDLKVKLKLSSVRVKYVIDCLENSNGTEENLGKLIEFQKQKLKLMMEKVINNKKNLEWKDCQSL